MMLKERSAVLPSGKPGNPIFPRWLSALLSNWFVVLGVCGSPPDPMAPAGAVPLTLENIYRDARNGVFSAAISPDGRWVAVAAAAESADGRGIHLLDLTEEPPVPRFWLDGSSPAWSPDSRRIAFLRDGNLFRAPVGDPDAVQLTDRLAGVRAPAWSPDGETVAVMSSASASQDVWFVPAAGGDPRRLTSGAMTAGEVRFGVSWSPDGGTVAYVGAQMVPPLRLQAGHGA